MIDRRGLLAGAAAGTLAGCVTVHNGGARRPLGLADITIQRELNRDYGGTLKQVAALGYDVMGFRLAGYGMGTELPPQEKARLVRAAGMEVGVVRLGVINPDYDRDLRNAADIGAKIVAMTTAPPFIAGPKLFETTRAKFDAWLPQLAALGDKARALGLTLAYHNHWYDFAPLGGERPLDIIARTVPPSLVSFEVDCAWAWYGGVSPVDLIARLGPRVVSMHWKDIDRRRGTTPTDHAVAPGQGEMHYELLIPRIRGLTRAVGYVEVDSPTDGLAAAAAAAKFIRGIR